jgi:anti-sigma regulatory factor (Ser/Thr protein kinase)
MVDVLPVFLHLTVPADAATLSGHLRLMRTFLHEHDVGHDTAHDIRLCVHECCANAIRHSGSSDDIDVRLTLDDEAVTVLVVDSGRGLDLTSCDPQRPPDPHETCGRGLFLMNQLMDGFEISVDGGTEVRMTKRLPSPVS